MTAKEYLETLSADEICHLGIEWGVIDLDEVVQRLDDGYGDLIMQALEEAEDE